MTSKPKIKKQSFTHIVDLFDNEITLNDIEYISKDLKTKLQYEKEFNRNLYSNILLYLTHSVFSESEAKRHWTNILEHRKNLLYHLNRDPGIIVACLDYMTNIAHLLSEPKIIEKGKSDFIVSTTLIDKLTNLYIRNVFDVVLDKEYSLAMRELIPLSLLMIDIDDFKYVNDTFGHAEGDQALRQIGNIINLSIRNMDFASRFGGEELAIIMPNTSLIHAMKVAELIRSRINELEIQGHCLSVSIGVSELAFSSTHYVDLIKESDLALYFAKKSGKNQVVGYTDSLNENV